MAQPMNGCRSRNLKGPGPVMSAVYMHHDSHLHNLILRLGLQTCFSPEAVPGRPGDEDIIISIETPNVVCNSHAIDNPIILYGHNNCRYVLAPPNLISKGHKIASEDEV